MHDLADLVAGLDDLWVDGELPSRLPITGISYRASTVEPGHLFVCLGADLVPELAGMDIGAGSIDAAIDAGAVAVLLDRALPAPRDRGVVTLRSADHARAAAELCARLHGHPSRHLRVVGVTGTNGKTTVAAMLRQIFEVAGATPASLGTLGVASRALTRPAGTSPARPRLSSSRPRPGCGRRASTPWCWSRPPTASRSGASGDRVRRRGLHQLHPDHLDLHGSLDAYREAKLSLFRRIARQQRKPAPLAIINADDPSAPAFPARRPPAAASSPTAPASPPNTARAGSTRRSTARLLRRRPPGGRVELRLPTPGRYNVANALAAFACAHASGLEPLQIARALAMMPAVPGRFEVVTRDPCAVIVDFAHTPDGLAKVLAAARPLCRGRLRVVFGCGGDRDRSKRPIMGRLAAAGIADRVYLTSDNPRSEDPAAILAEIAAGSPSSSARASSSGSIAAGRSPTRSPTRARTTSSSSPARATRRRRSSASAASPSTTPRSSGRSPRRRPVAGSPAAERALRGRVPEIRRRARPP
ncbi:MAG: UDP-N-acetylmuramoyl-L-alanyl-D-glutamate--2,6-diaminopimelate ligase [Myxococcales bacterium]|nr:UDP-N-acetylmuramoyl-L-alanyl-D-glutamate--2,6-diaminopimelate ligase [Myxococcales bacterium]